jgi:isopentenyl-diphosphate delta-isomerase
LREFRSSIEPDSITCNFKPNMIPFVTHYMDINKPDTHIALVDEHDNIVGYGDKLKVHQEGVLHRAFSVVVINGKGQWLLHRRAQVKYHSPGVWTNTCCSHLTRGESMQEASQKRLLSEMGIAANTEFVDSFQYRAEFENGLIEHEIDHVYIARWEGEPDPDPDEVMDWKWCHTDEIEEDLNARPREYSAWFPMVYDLLKSVLSNPS